MLEGNDLKNTNPPPNGSRLEEVPTINQIEMLWQRQSRRSLFDKDYSCVIEDVFQAAFTGKIKKDIEEATASPAADLHGCCCGGCFSRAGVPP